MQNSWMAKTSIASSGNPQTPPRPPPKALLQTPIRPSSATEEGNYELVAELQNVMNIELKDAWVEEGSTAPFKAHLNAVFAAAYPPDMDQQIQTWIDGYHGYDNDEHRWHNIPQTTAESDLYTPLTTLYNDILGGLNQGCARDALGEIQKMRLAQDTHHIKQPHTRPDEETKLLKSEPDISLLGSGGCISQRGANLEAVYPFVSKLSEVKLTPSLTDKVKGQIAVYAREVFIQQPNRRFVYVDLITPDVFRILHFDRAGCYYTQPIDYHEDAVFFVKTVLLGSALNEEFAGFDTSVYWENGKRKLRFISDELYNPDTNQWEENTADMVFDLDDNVNFVRPSIRGRGTVCWSGEYLGRRYIVKDYWRADGRDCESEYLKDLTGVRGVGQMFAFQNNQQSLLQNRGLASGVSTEDPAFSDHWFMRIVTLEYGPTLEYAEPREFVQAIIDVAEAHRTALIDKGILHRDISFDNIRLSLYPGETAVLIDWDMAKRMKDLIHPKPGTPKVRTGTRAYQSIKILTESVALGHHDNMDDLESIFYVVYVALFGYDSSKRILDDAVRPSYVTTFLSPRSTDNHLLTSKSVFIVFEGENSVSRFGGGYPLLLAAMVDKHRSMFLVRCNNVKTATRAANPTPFPKYSPTTAIQQYTEFIEIARQTLESLPPDPVPAAIAPASPRGSTAPQTPKRRFVEVDVESPKRQKLTQAQSSSVAMTSSDNKSARPKRDRKPLQVSDNDDDEGADGDYKPGRTVTATQKGRGTAKHNGKK
ncbi:hypothetical protein C8F01DRAFT_1154574 [Mycena amicta]|nr:hypothetical protein C8F01DRAFT_1154574 [Mycena amicta]